MKFKLNEILLWLGICVVTLAAFFGTYALQFSAPILVMIWIAWLVSSLGLGYFTTPGQRAFEFAKDAKSELEKVVWPTRQETIQTTTIVMVMVTVTGFVLWGIDSGMMWIIRKITHLG